MRVAAVFDNVVRPDTTGVYCLAALRDLCDVVHLTPAALAHASARDFDLFLYIDDGLHYEFPARLRPSALWAIDTHIDPRRLLSRAASIDCIFAAQRNGVELLRRHGIDCVGWLPLACDPGVHRRHDLPLLFDVCFIGHMLTPERRQLAEIVQQNFARNIIGQRFFNEMARTYSASRIVLNLSVRDDVNMRVFEALACGSLLLTNDVRLNGLDRLFRDGEHLVTFRDFDDLLEKARHYLAHEQDRRRIADAGHEAVLAEHTYRLRMAVLLDHVANHLKGAGGAVASRPAHAGMATAPAAAGRGLTSIVIVTRNQLQHTRRCIGSIRACTATLPYQLIVVDNGSGDFTRQYVRECGGDVILQENESNRGFPAAANQGIAQSTGDFVLLLNNDTIVTPGWLERMLAAMRSMPDTGLVGPCSNAVHGPQRVKATYDTTGLHDLDEFAARFARCHAGRTQETDVLVGFCLLIRREVIDRIGMLDEGFGIGTYEDYDYCRRAAAHGYRLFIAADAYVHHVGTVTFAAENTDVASLSKDNAATFRSRWQEPASPVGLTSIVLVTFGQLALTRACIESIRRCTPEAHEVIVVDNGSTDGTLEYLRGLAEVHVIENGRNLGFPAAANLGMRLARGQQVLLLNNDVVVTRGWLGRLARGLRSACDIGLAGPCANSVSGPQRVATSYGEDLRGLEKFAAQWAGENERRIVDAQRLVGFCLLIRRDVIDRIGLLDERFGVGNFEDDDYCLRAQAAGFRAVIVREAFVHHFGSATFKAVGVDYRALMARNEQLFLEKWAQPLNPPEPGDAGPPSKLSMCMIARDSSRTIGAALESIKPWVDEMIVVDTGSTDDTPRIAAAAGARVSHFPWCDDFAAARNASLSQASGDWLFWMDSDDTIDQANGRRLRELTCRTHAPQTMGFILQVHCPSGAQGQGVYATETAVDHVKVIRNRPEIRFSGRIHEQVLPAIRSLGGEIQWTNIYVVHSGSCRSEESRARKHARDLRLLELEIKDNPDSTFALFNLGMTLLDMGRFADALGPLCQSFQLATPAESHVRKLYAMLTQCYSGLERPAAALGTCARGLELFPDDPELLFRRGVLEQAAGRLDQSERSFRAVLKLSGGESGGAGGRSQVFSSIDQGILGVKSWHNLAVVYERLGRWIDATKAWEAVLQYDRSNFMAWRGLLAALSAAGDVAGLQRAVAVASAEPGVPDDVSVIARARLSDAEGDSAGAATQLESAVNASPSNDLLHELCELAFRREMSDVAERALKELTRREPDDAAAYHNLAAILLRRGDCEGAAENARRSLALRPASTPTRDLLAGAERMLKAASLVAAQGAAGIEVDEGS